MKSLSVLKYKNNCVTILFLTKELRDSNNRGNKDFSDKLN